MKHRRVMVIVYYWPPLAGSGVHRWLKMTKYFERYGVQPVIVTPKNPYYHLLDDSLLDDVPKNAEVIKLPIFEPYKIAELLSGSKVDNTGKSSNELSDNMSLSKRVQRYIRTRFFIPDPRKYWARPTIKFLKKYLQDNPVDAIITSGPPHSLHMIGLGLKKSGMDIPWIADFRDPMSHIDFMDTMGVKGSLLEKYKHIERDILQAADYVVGTTPSLPVKLENFDTSKYRCVTNGYDDADFETSKTEQGNYIFHAGLINEFRNALPLWEALNEYNQHHDPIELRLAGTVNDLILNTLKKYPHVYEHLNMMGYISHDEVLENYATSLANVLLLNDTDNARVCIPGKIFELLASRKPLLAIGSKESDAYAVMKETGVGEMYDYDAQPKEIVRFLEQLQSRTIKRKEDEIEKYERKYLTKKYLELIYKNEL